MFRFAIFVLAIVGLVGIIGGAFGTTAAGVGALVLLPILLFKLLFIFMIFGFFGKAMARRGGPRHWQGARWDRPETERPSREERFDEWHRMAHAREEVDSWVEGMPDTEQE